MAEVDILLLGGVLRSIFIAIILLFNTPAFSATPILGPARAHWADAGHILFKLGQGVHASQDIRFLLAESSAHPQTELPLIHSENRTVTLSTSQIDSKLLDSLLQRPMKIFVMNGSGQILDSSSIHFTGVLNQHYYYAGDDLGVRKRSAKFVAKLWAPTASRVKMHLYAKADSNQTQPDNSLTMTRTQGVWSAEMPARFKNFFYLYEVTVFQPFTDQVETSFVTDPYSFGLSMNGEKSQILDPESAETKPSGWDHLQKPSLSSLKDAVIYEMHIRDFTAADHSMPEMFRGTFQAFSQSRTTSMMHLQALAEAGLTHVHLMPFNDFGSVNENRRQWQNFSGPSSALEEPQNIIGRMRQQDPYNWGYDPVHYFTPEGSYASKTDGITRIREVRGMVQALAGMKLRLVQDVIFNHTYRNGVQAYSVLDRIVPLYYYRLNDEGLAYDTSCCPDTATENRMMEKLMIDAVVYWAKTFKIDGFRFDLMAFHSHESMIHVREALRKLTLEKDGVDGSKIIIFGEGWLFGSLYNQSPQTATTALNSYGMGIGFFNDRLRDATRGGTTNTAEKSDQGFATGLFSDFNQEPANRNTPPDLGSQREKLLHLGDVIKAGLAGNLRDYAFRDHRGEIIKSSELKFRGEQTANAAQAVETINYVSAHDGYSLWDAIQAKAPFFTAGRTPSVATTEDRRRMAQLAIALPLLGQGIPFVESGSEMLRSKSGDQDSYDSGDYFNNLNWTGNDNNWGHGLPPVWKNFTDWNFWRPRLESPALKASSDDITLMTKYFKGLLLVRKTESLFKLNTFSDITAQVSFLDNDAQSEAGLIVMHLKNTKTQLLVIFNADRNPRQFGHPVFQKNWKLHPQFDAQVDPTLADVKISADDQNILIPGRTTIVLKEAP